MKNTRSLLMGGIALALIGIILYFIMQSDFMQKKPMQVNTAAANVATNVDAGSTSELEESGSEITEALEQEL